MRLSDDLANLPLNAEQSGRILQRSATTIRRWGTEGRLPSVAGPSGHRRYRMADVVALAEKQADA